MRKGQNVPKDYIRKKKKVKCRFFFPLVQRRILFPPPPLHIPDEIRLGLADCLLWSAPAPRC